MEKRDLNISFYKAGNGGISTKMNLPKKWIEKMGITQDDKGVEVVFDEDKKTITIMKRK